MAKKKNKRRTPSAIDVGQTNLNVAKDIRTKQPQEQSKPPARDFGLLEVRGMTKKESAANIYYQTNGIGASTNFSRMSNTQLISIINGADMQRIRELSRWFAKTNGVYARAVRYIADLVKFDFMIYPNLDLDIEVNEALNKTVLKQLNKVLEYFDSSSVQLMARRWSNTVCLEGAYYGYICDDVRDKLVVQDLPIKYCRSRFFHRGLPVIEFNVQYFDKVTSDATYRRQLLALFPEEFQLAYQEYKSGKLPAEGQSEDAGWIILDSKRAFKLNFSDDDLPPFLYAIPALIELDEVQDLEKEKLLQEIQKILVQKFELNKNGEIPFTMTELQRLNQNAIDMVGDAVGVSVLSTVAEVELEDLATDGDASTSAVAAAENTVYNAFGISANLFNTDGNLALEKSTITDAAYSKPLLLQVEQMLNNHLEWKFSKREVKFRLKMLTTTIFNDVDMSDKYKDLTKIGFSRFLPMVALGHSQKEVVSMAKLEQQIMELDNWMLPPFSSNTMSSDTWQQVKEIQQSGAAQKAAESVGEGGKGGRPETPDSKKSDKTIANKEAEG